MCSLPLAHLLQLSVLAGPSGVGKSSLINLVRLDIRGDVIGAGGGNKGRAASGGGGVADWAESASLHSCDCSTPDTLC